MHATDRPRDRGVLRPAPAFRRRILGSSALVGVGLVGLGAWPALANPSGGTVVGGSASIAQTNPTTVTITQTSERGAVNWQSFSIAPNETTRFVQPNADATTLNRVTGNNLSVIAGHLEANGNIILINTQGILFANGSQVDVNSLTATPADIKTQEFMAGGTHFDTPSPKADAAVVNEGTITVASSGLAALVAPRVANSGVINAKLGRVVLAGANTFTVDLYGDGLVSFDVSSRVAEVATDKGAALVTNTGTITADGGHILLTAKAVDGILSDLVDARGTIRAETVGSTAGHVAFDGDGGTVKLAGSVDVSGLASGQSAGSVTITGKKVVLAGAARIDASGDAGGGLVEVGGGLHGADPALTNAKTTIVRKGATIDANAVTSGKGGTVAVWADNKTLFGGSITATGGAAGGDGGMVETSGHQSLTVAGGAVDTSAALGKTGTWLLDPGDADITHSTTTAGGTSPFTGAVVDFDINNGLKNNNVIVETNGAGGITLEATANINWTTANTLTLDASQGGGLGNITLKGTINGGTKGTLVLDSASGGTVTDAAGAAISAAFLDLGGAGATFTLTNGTNGFGTLAAATQNVSINNGGNALTIGTANGVTGIGLTGTLSLTKLGAVTLAGNIVVGAGGVDLSTATSISLLTGSTIDTHAGSGAVLLAPLNDGNAAGTDSLAINSGAGAITLGSIGATTGIGTLSLATTTNITDANQIKALDLGISGTGTSYAFTNTANDIGLLSAGTGALTLNNGGNALTIGTVNGVTGIGLTGGLSLTNLGAVTLAGNIVVGAGGVDLSTATSISLLTGSTIDTHAGNGAVLLAPLNDGNAAGKDSLAINSGAGAITLGSIGATTGIGTLSLATTTNITDANQIKALDLGISGTGTSYAFTNTANDIGLLSAGTGALTLNNGGNALTIGTVNGVTGIGLTGGLSLTNLGAVTLAGNIVVGAGGVDLSTATSISLLTGSTIDTHAGSGAVLLAPLNDGNAAGKDSLAINSGAGAITLGSIGATTGIGTLSLATTTNVTDANQIKALGLGISGTGTGYAFTNTANDIGLLSAKTGALTLNNGGNALTIGTVNAVTGIDLTGGLSFTKLGAATLAGNITVGTGGVDLSTTTTGSSGITLTQSVIIDSSAGSGPVSLAPVNDGNAAGTDSLTINSGAGAITLASVGAATAIGTLSLNTTTNVTDANAIDASALALAGAGTSYTLSDTAIGMLAANTGSVTLANGKTALSIGSADGINGVIVTGLLSLTDTGTVTQTQAITAPTLELLGTGGSFNFTGLTKNSNDIGILAADSASVSLDNGANNLSIGTAGGTAGVTVTTLLSLSDTGAVTQTQPISATALELLGTGGSYNFTGLTKASNDVTTLAADTGTVSLDNGTNNLGIGTAGGTGGVTVASLLSLADTGTVTETKAVAAASLELLGTGGTYTFSGTGNDVATLASNTGSVSLNNGANALGIGTAGGTAGATVTGTLVLTDTGLVTQTALIDAPNLLLAGNGGGFTLTSNQNVIGTLAANTGSLSVTDSAPLTLNTVAGISNVTATGNVALTADSITLTPATGTIVATGETVTLEPLTAEPISIGGTKSFLSSASANLVTAATLQIGGANAQSIDITAAMAPTVTTLLLTSTGEIQQEAGATITVGNLGVSAGKAAQAIALTEANNISTVALSGTGAIAFADGGKALSIGTVGGITGISSGGGDVSLIDSGAVSQTQAINLGTGGLSLTDGGTATGTWALDGVANTVATLAASTGTVRLNDGATALAIGTVNGTVGVNATTLVLTDTGNVSQTAPITASGLELLGTGGAYDFSTMTNKVATLAAATGSVLLDDGATTLSIGTVGVAGVTLSGNLTISDTGSVSQTEAVSAAGLDLVDGGAGTGAFDFTGAVNKVATLAGNTGSIDLADGATALSIGTVGTAGVTVASTLTVNDTNAVSQTALIKANGLEALGGGSYTLNDAGNQITDLAGNTAAISLTDSIPLDLTQVGITSNLTATGAVTLMADSIAFSATNGKIEATGQIVTLEPFSTSAFTIGTAGSFDPGNLGNITADTLILGGSKATSLTLNGSINASGVNTLELISSGEVSEGVGATITTKALAVSAGTAVTAIDLGSTNSVGNVALAGTGIVIFNNAGSGISWTIGTVAGLDGIDAGTGSVTLTSFAPVSQTKAITAAGLDLEGAIAAYNLTGVQNAVGVLAGDTQSVKLDDGATALSIGTVNGVIGLRATTLVSLTDTGTVSETAPITTPALELLGAGGAYALDTSTNDVQFLAANAASVSINNGANPLSIGTVNTTSGVTLSGNFAITDTGNVSQTAAITVGGLDLLGAGGAYTLSNIGNRFTTLAGNLGAAGTATLTESGGTLSIGTVGATAGLTAQSLQLTEDGTLTQTQALTLGQLNVEGGATGLWNLTGVANAVQEIAGATQSLALDNGATNLKITLVGGANGLNIGAGTLTLKDTGTVSQDKDLLAKNLELLGTGGTYTLTGPGNDVGTLAANTGTVSLDNGANTLSIGTAGGTSGATLTSLLRLTDTGTVNETAAINTPALELLGTGGTYTLTGTGNDVGILASDTATVSLNNGANNLIIGTAGGTSGATVTSVLTLTDTGTVTQTEAINAPELELLGAGGTYTLTGAGNDVGTLATKTATVDFNDGANNLIIGTAGGTSGATVTALLTLADTGTVSQTAAISGPELELLGAGGTYTLTGPGNDVGILATNTGIVSLNNGANGLIIGTAGGTTGATVTSLLTLTDTGTVSQTAAIVAPALELLGTGGTYALTGTGNDVGTLATETATVSLNNGANNLIIGTAGGTTGAAVTSLLTLTDTGTVSQTAAISGPALELLGTGGTYTLTGAGNDVGILAANTGTVSLDNGANSLFIGTAGGTSGATLTSLLTLTDTGTVNETQPIATPALELLGSGGTYTLTGPGNDVGILASNTATVSLDNGANALSMGTAGGTSGATVTNLLTLIDTGTVTQTQAIIAPDLELLGGGGTYTLTGTKNDVGTLATKTATVDFNDGANNLGIGTAGGTSGATVTALLTLADTGTVSQTAAVIAPALELLGTGGTYTLTGPGNDVGILATNTGIVSLNNGANGLIIGTAGGTTGATVTSLLTLTDTGTVSQTAAIVAPALELLGTGSTYALTGTGNDVGTLATETATVSLNNGANNLSIGTAGGTTGATVTSLLTLTDTGTVTQTAAINGPALELLGTGGTYTLTGPGNDVGILATKTATVDLDNGANDLSIGTAGGTSGATVTSLLTLADTGTVTQTQAINAPALELLGTGGTYTLTGTGNDVGILASDTATVSLNNGANNLIIGTAGGTSGATVTSVLTLTDTGTVTQTEAINAPELELLGAGGTYTLTGAGNDVGTLATKTATVDFNDGANNLIIGTAGGTSGATVTALLTLADTGTVSQTAAISGPELELLGAGGTYTLTGPGNDVGILATNTAIVSLDNGANGLIIGTAGGTTGATVTSLLTLTDTGTVSQTAAIVAPALELLGTGGTYALTGTGNDVGTLATETATVSLNNGANNLIIGTAGGTTGAAVTSLLTLTDTGTVSQTAAISGPALELLGTGGTYTLTGAGNDVGILAANTGTVSLDNGANSLFIGTAGGTSGATLTSLLTLTDTGTVNETQPIATPALELLGSGGTFNLSGGNSVATLATDTGTVIFNGASGFNIGTAGGTSGATVSTLLTLIDSGTVTQTAAVTAPALELLGSGGTYSLTGAGNDVGTLATKTATVSLDNGANPLSIGTVGGTSGATVTALLTLADTGTVSQTAAVIAPALELLGTGGTYTLTGPGNDVGILATNTATVSLDNGANKLSIGTAGGTSGATVTSLLTLTDTATVTQTAAVVTPELELLGAGGTYTLTGTGNDVAVLATNTGTVSLNNGTNDLSIGTAGGTSGVMVTSLLTLTVTDGAVVTQTQPIVGALALELLGSGGVYDLSGMGNDVVTLATNTGTVSLDNGGNPLIIGTAGGTSGATVTNLLSLADTGFVTQTKAIRAPSLELLGTGGTYTLTGTGNDVGILASDTATVSLNNGANNLIIGTAGSTSGATVTSVLTLTDTGTVTQTEAINAPELELLGAGGTYTLIGTGNDVETLATKTKTVDLDNGGNALSIGTAGGTSGATVTGLLTLSDTGTVTQTRAITAPALELLGAGGIYTLTGTGNDVGILATNTAAVSLNNGANNLSIGTAGGTSGATVTSLLTLTDTGTVTQTQPVTATALELLGTGGTYTLTGTGNDVGLLATDTATVGLNNGANTLSIGTAGGTSGATVTALLTLTDTGTVTQTEAITAPALELLGAGGTYSLTDGGNVVSTLAGATGTIMLNDGATSLTIGKAGGTTGVNTATLLSLTDTGSVIEAASVATPALELLGTGGSYLLTAAGNDVGMLASNTGTIALDNGANGLVIGNAGATSGATVTNTLTLTDTGSVTQVAAISAPGLDLLGAGGSYTLTGGTNAIGTVAGNTGTITLTDGRDLVIGAVTGTAGVTVANSLTLTDANLVSQTEAITAPGLSLLGSNGTYVLTGAGNDIGTLATNTGAVSLDDGANALTIGSVAGTNGATVTSVLALTDTGSVTQTEAIVAPALGLLGAGGTYTLASTSNAIVTLAANTGAITLNDGATGLGIGSVQPAGSATAINGVTVTGDFVLTDTGAVGQSQAITAAGLDLLGAGGSYTLTNGGNDITKLAADTGSIDLNNGGNLLTVDTVAGTVGITLSGPLTLTANGITLNTPVTLPGDPVVFNSTGTVSQLATAPITAGSLTITSSAPTDLPADNQITSIAGLTQTGPGAIVLTVGSSFAVTGPVVGGGNITIDATSGDLKISGTVTSTGANGTVILEAPVGSVTITAPELTAGQNVIISGLGVQQTGAITLATPLTIIDDSGTIYTAGVTPPPPSFSVAALTAYLTQFSQERVPTYPTKTLTAGILLGQVIAPHESLVIVSGVGPVTGDINVLAFGLLGSVGGSSNLTGMIKGVSGGAAAQNGRAEIGVNREPADNKYKINACAIGSPTCIVLPAVVPVEPQSVELIDILQQLRQFDDVDIERMDTGKEDLYDEDVY